MKVRTHNDVLFSAGQNGIPEVTLVTEHPEEIKYAMSTGEVTVAPLPHQSVLGDDYEAILRNRLTISFGVVSLLTSIPCALAILSRFSVTTRGIPPSSILASSSRASADKVRLVKVNKSEALIRGSGIGSTCSISFSVCRPGPASSIFSPTDSGDAVAGWILSVFSVGFGEQVLRLATTLLRIRRGFIFRSGKQPGTPADYCMIPEHSATPGIMPPAVVISDHGKPTGC